MQIISQRISTQNRNHHYIYIAAIKYQSLKTAAVTAAAANEKQLSAKKQFSIAVNLVKT